MFRLDAQYDSLDICQIYVPHWTSTSSGPPGHQARKPIDADLFRLLKAIKRTGKLTLATSEVGLPYRQAWGLITMWSERMGQPLVVKEQGRGTNLTALGERLLWIRERINARLAPHLESAASEVEQQLSEILNEPHPALCVHASHDLVLAELRDLLRTGSGPKLDVRFVGSLESVIALCKSQCEIAGFHLPEDPLRNKIFPKYEPWLKPRVQRLIHFVRRAQGLIVAPGNPPGHPKPRRRRPDQGAIHQSAARLRHPSRIGQDAGRRRHR